MRIIIKRALLYLWENFTSVDYRKQCRDERYTLMSCLFCEIFSKISEKRLKFRFKKGMLYTDFEEFEDIWTDNWNLLYSEGLTRDYYWYSRLPYWHNAEYMRGVYEIFDIFEYSPDRYKNLIIRMFKSYWLDSDGYTPIEHYFDCFKKDYLINENWFTLENILGEYFVDAKELPFEEWTKSYVWVLYGKDWHKEGFMKLFAEKKLIMIWCFIKWLSLCDIYMVQGTLIH